MLNFQGVCHSLFGPLEVVTLQDLQQLIFHLGGAQQYSIYLK